MNNTEKSAHPQPVMQVKITAIATQAIVSHFMSEATKGNVDKAGTIIPKKIVTPQKPALVGADGRPVQ